MADIVLYDRTGKAVTYSGVETITTDTTTDGEKATFTSGVLTDNPVVDLDLSEGDQELEVPSGYLVTGATISKPETLTAENIKSGVSIAGIEGTYEGSKTVAVQSDYNQPDYTENDYIKNRPFYDNDLLYKNEALSFTKQSSSVSGLYGRVGFLDYLELDTEKPYKLVTDGFANEGTAENYTASDGVTYQIVGNVNAFKASMRDTTATSFDANGSTFVSLAAADPEETGVLGMSYVMQWFDTEDACVEGNAPVEFYSTAVKKIDPKFIPTESLDVSWNNVSDKPFYESTRLTYDGNREGKEIVDEMLIKVSDDVFEFGVGDEVTIVSDGEAQEAGITEVFADELGNVLVYVYGAEEMEVMYSITGDVYIDDSGEFTTDGTGTLCFSKGTYFLDVETETSKTYVSSASTKAKQLSPDVIPQLSVSKLDEQPFVYAENKTITVTFDGVLEHALEYIVADSSYTARISSVSKSPTIGDKVVVMDVDNGEEVETTISEVIEMEGMVMAVTERYAESLIIGVAPEDVAQEGMTYKKGVWIQGEIDSDGNVTGLYLKSWTTTVDGYVLSADFLPEAPSEGTVILEAVDGRWQVVPFEQSQIKAYIDNLINGTS